MVDQISPPLLMRTSVCVDGLLRSLRISRTQGIPNFPIVEYRLGRHRMHIGLLHSHPPLNGYLLWRAPFRIPRKGC